MNTWDPAEYCQLTPLWFSILVATVDGPTHGSPVIKEIEKRDPAGTSRVSGTV